MKPAIKDPIRITSLTRIFHKMRRWLSKTEWAVWLLGLSRTKQNPTQTGLILIQVDGLSEKQFVRAVAEGRMPFLQSLIKKQNYVRHTLYSGLPSSTPSVQGELFYGKRSVVPAFGFRDHRTGRLVRMFAGDIVAEIETRMSETEPGLLAGGSSYGNIYGGGADDVHFCATSFGWSEFFRTVNPFQLMLLMLLNIVMFVRILGLMFIEFWLATFDFFRGIVSGREFWQELIMIPARVTVVVLLRELVTIGACFDSARGQPIIYVNFLGYDEQAHRRGPGSRFAHWTLRGIDHSIRRIWNSAHRGAGREYDVWVCSDHGQEATVPYQLAYGKPIQQVVAELVDQCCPDSANSKQKFQKGRLPSRANWLGIGWLVSMMFGEQDHDIQARSPNVQTVTSGPLGFIYLLNDEARNQRDKLARKLVDNFSVPMAAVRDGLDSMSGQRARVFTAKGSFVLPQEAVEVFGPDHPFLHDVAEDIVKLVHHVDSGDIVLVGWSPKKKGTAKHGKDKSTSFVLQHGAHAGPGTEETRAFVLLPPDIQAGSRNKGYLRPEDLRQAALRFLGRSTQRQSLAVSRSINQPIRILTYNVHACVGMDGQLSPERIARVISQSGADIICLQELDVFRHRSGNRDQAHAIARWLGMNHQFHPAWQLEEEQFGNAVLSRLPMVVVESIGLHHHKSDRSRRSALWVEIEIGDVALQVINTHLSIYPKEQLIQAKQLLEEWVQPASLLGPVVLCGDFNARPKSRTCKVFSSFLSDVESFEKTRTRASYFSPFPITRVDHVFVADKLSALRTNVIDTRLAKIASDHLPLLVDLRVLPDSSLNALTTEHGDRDLQANG